MRQTLKQRLASIFKALAGMSAHPAFADRPSGFTPLAGPLAGVIDARTVARVDAAPQRPDETVCAARLAALRAEIAVARARRATIRRLVHAPAADHLGDADEARDIAALKHFPIQRDRRIALSNCFNASSLPAKSAAWRVDALVSLQIEKARAAAMKGARIEV